MKKYDRIVILGIMCAIIVGCTRGTNNERNQTTTMITNKNVGIVKDDKPLMLDNFASFDFSESEYRVGFSMYYVIVNDQYHKADNLYLLYDQKQFNSISVVLLKQRNHEVLPFAITNSDVLQNFISVITFYFEDIALIKDYETSNQIIFSNDTFFVYTAPKISEDIYESDEALSYCKDQICEELVLDSQSYFRQVREYMNGANQNLYIFKFIESFIHKES